LQHLFPVPKPDTKRIITFANESDYISFRLVYFLILWEDASIGYSFVCETSVDKDDGGFWTYNIFINVDL
jgi:hypothetical protein